MEVESIQVPPEKINYKQRTLTNMYTYVNADLGVSVYSAITQITTSQIPYILGQLVLTNILFYWLDVEMTNPLYSVQYKLENLFHHRDTNRKVLGTILKKTSTYKNKGGLQHKQYCAGKVPTKQFMKCQSEPTQKELKKIHNWAYQNLTYILFGVRHGKGNIIFIIPRAQYQLFTSMKFLTPMDPVGVSIITVGDKMTQREDI